MTEEQGRKKRVLRALLVLSGILTLGLLYLLLVRLTGFGIPCVLHVLTGWDCPGCGLTRAFVALSRGQFREALAYNPMLPLYSIYALWLFLTAVIRYRKGEEILLPGRPLWIHVGMLILILLFGVLRNLL